MQAVDHSRRVHWRTQPVSTWQYQLGEREYFLFGGQQMNPTICESRNAIINVDELIARCMGNTGIAERILAKFQERFCVDLRELEQGVSNHDTGAVAQAAHRIKGASGNVSAPAIYQLASEIERLARTEHMEEIRANIEQLEVEWTRFANTVSTLSFS